MTINEQQSWHSQSIKTVCRVFKVTSSGLSNDEAQLRLQQYGRNALQEPVKNHPFLRFLLQFHHTLIYVLLAASMVTAFLHHLMDTLVILAVVVINALVGFIQEGKAQQALDSIRKMLTPVAMVLRNGERLSIVGEEVVPGDIVLLEAGDKVPADVRLWEVHGLTIQEAILTGESVPVEKQAAPVSAASLGDRSCMAFSGTLVTTGQATGIVVATGQRTQIGQISHLLSTVDKLDTPLLLQMGRFANRLTRLTLLVAGLLLAYGYFFQHHSLDELLMVVVGFSVAAIPEGLPAVLSITLAIGVQVMARRNAIVRRLPAIETIGSVSVICTDKTGTLTLNEMIVASVVTEKNIFTLNGSGYAPTGTVQLNNKVIHQDKFPLLMELAQASIHCNNALLYEQEGRWAIDGDPMEGALLAFAEKINPQLRDDRKVWARTDMIAFDSKHSFMATLHHNHWHEAFVFIKGAPETILSRSQHQKTEEGGVVKLNEPYWLRKIDDIAAKGQRVLALAIKPVKPEHTVLEFKDLECGLIFLGLVGLVDPPRPEAVKAIDQCHKAGIHVKMITGDHASTALAIGQHIGLRHHDRALTGAELNRLSDDELARAVLVTDIFARTSPEQKLRLVMALQSHGMTVAMTGDGVNDAPALKRADIGIAMGRTGSEVAKESAELVLVDDNFASIVAAVREGRTVYDNIKKVMGWSLPTNAGEAMTIFVAVMFGMALPVTPIQILWVNLITTITLGLTLAFEPTEENTMSRPPRLRQESLIGGVLAWQIIFVSILFVGCVFGLYFHAIERGYSEALAQTIALNTLVVLEIFHLFFIRNRYGTSFTWRALKGTWAVWIAIVVITLAQFAMTYLPVFQQIFITESIPIRDGFLIVLVGILFFVVIEAEKQIRLFLARRPRLFWGKE